MHSKAPGIYKTLFDLSRPAGGIKDQQSFFTDFFDKLAGGPALRNAILSSASAEELEAIYSEGLDSFQLIRKKYLLYPDFDE
jgi:uncharacterized protein YbbC (DUF1343 family)